MRARPGFAGKDPRIVLLGMMGSGKSTIGRMLAERTGWPYLDNDDLLARHLGMGPREVLAAVGEEGLRRAESDALRLGLECAPPCIVGVAAGTILDDSNRRAMREAGVVVWLRASVATLSSRAAGTGGVGDRPWLDEDPEAWFRSAAAERDPLYAEVADLIIDTDEMTPEQVTDRILARVA